MGSHRDLARAARCRQPRAAPTARPPGGHRGGRTPSRRDVPARPEGLAAAPRRRTAPGRHNDVGLLRTAVRRRGHRPEHRVPAGHRRGPRRRRGRTRRGRTRPVRVLAPRTAADQPGDRLAVLRRTLPGLPPRPAPRARGPLLRRGQPVLHRVAGAAPRPRRLRHGSRERHTLQRADTARLRGPADLGRRRVGRPRPALPARPRGRSRRAAGPAHAPRARAGHVHPADRRGLRRWRVRGPHRAGTAAAAGRRVRGRHPARGTAGQAGLRARDRPSAQPGADPPVGRRTLGGVPSDSPGRLVR